MSYPSLPKTHHPFPNWIYKEKQRILKSLEVEAQSEAKRQTLCRKPKFSSMFMKNRFISFPKISL